jgi:Raf kinase inhibitor-like YbhB/YbcL family protein
MGSTRVQRKSLMSFVLVVVCIGALIASVSIAIPLLVRSHTAHAAPAATASTQPFTLTSPTFHDGGPLPKSAEFNQDGCNGGNIAPELNWVGVPKGTQGFAFTITDYDAPVTEGFHHWVVYNIPGSARELEGNHPFSEGMNDFGLTGYDGPCPPPDGLLHHYVFRLYALSTSHISGKALTFDQLLKAINPFFIGAVSIVGTFKLPS